MTPSQRLVEQHNNRIEAVDARGRRFVLRQPTALDTLRLLKAAGPTLALNDPWLAMAGLVFSVVELDGVPVPSPATEHQIEGLVERFGGDGLDAIARALQAPEAADQAAGPALGNSHGTPS